MAAMIPGLGGTELIIMCCMALFPLIGILLAVFFLRKDSKHTVPAQPPAVPAAWLEDPTGRHQLRYWDGMKWTSNVGDNGVQTEDAI